MSDTLKQYFEIRKVDAEQRMVWGYASTESVDVQGETVTKAAMEDAWTDYMQFANVREMHQPSAVGVVKEYEFRDNGVFIGAKIVDDAAWQKVQEQVYKGFSIGGKKKPGGYDPLTKTITALRLTEISLVDRPANPEALIEMFKADLETEPMSDATKTEPTQTDQLKELIAKGNITPERLLEIVEAEVKKAAGTGEQTEAQSAQPTAEGQTEATPPVVEEVPAVAKAAAPLGFIQRTLRLVASGDEEAVKKGIYDIGTLANLLNSLRYVQADSASEAQYEGDSSPVPAKLAECIKALGAVLLEMAQEEVGELMQTLKADGADKDPLELLTEKVAAMVESSQHAGEIHKTIKGVTDVIKFDEGAIAKAVEGAVAAYAAKFDDIQKSLTEHDALVKMVQPMKDQLADLEKRWAKTPAAPKAALTAIAKGDDGDPLLTGRQDTGPTLKADGTVDVEAEIRKVHQSGGRPIGG